MHSFEMKILASKADDMYSFVTKGQQIPELFDQVSAGYIVFGL